MIYTKTLDGELNFFRLSVLKRMRDICMAATEERIQEDNSVGGMFIAKSLYGLSDSSPQLLQVQSIPAIEASPEQIAAKYKDIQIPEKPDFS